MLEEIERFVLDGNSADIAVAKAIAESFQLLSETTVLSETRGLSKNWQL